MTAKKSKWISMITKQAFPSMRLFCFPYSGGSAQVFNSWKSQLSDSIQICGIQYPGRGSRFTEPAYTSLDALLPELHREIKAFLDVPFAFFGHSLGASICFELARALEAEGYQPKHVFVSGRNEPNLPRQTPMLHGLPEPEFRKEVETLGGTSPEVLEHPELMDLVAPLLRADFTVSETYKLRPGATLKAALTAFGGAGDPLVPAKFMEGWGAHTEGPFACQILDGGHFFLDEKKDELLQRINAVLTTS